MIAAYFDTRESGHDRRGDTRRNLRFDTVGAGASAAHAQVSVHNLSATGLLLETRADLQMGERLSIELPQAGSVDAEIMWVDGNFYGCKFTEELGQAALSAAQLVSQPDQPDADQPEESFGSRLQRLRKERRLTMADVGERLGVSKTTIWAWEQGKSRPQQDRLDLLAEVLGTSSGELTHSMDTPALRELLTRSREEIAAAFGTSPANVRIMIEL